MLCRVLLHSEGQRLSSPLMAHVQMGKETLPLQPRSCRTGAWSRREASIWCGNQDTAEMGARRWMGRCHTSDAKGSTSGLPSSYNDAPRSPEHNWESYASARRPQERNVKSDICHCGFRYDVVKLNKRRAEDLQRKKWGIFPASIAACSVPRHLLFKLFWYHDMLLSCFWNMLTCLVKTVVKELCFAQYIWKLCIFWSFWGQINCIFMSQGMIISYPYSVVNAECSTIMYYYVWTWCCSGLK